MAPGCTAATPATSGAVTAGRARRSRSRAPRPAGHTRRPARGGSAAKSAESSCARSRHRVDGEALRVLLRIGRVEGDAVEERFLFHVLTRCLDPHVLGHLAEDVGPMHAIDEALVLRRLLDHPPAAELGEPPDAV